MLLPFSGLSSGDSSVEPIGAIGIVDATAIQQQVATIKGKRSSSYTKWCPKDRYNIGKYASENGPIAAVRKFSGDYPSLNESTARGFRKKYEEEIKKATKEKREPSKAISKYSAPTGRPLMLGELDSMIQAHLLAQSRNGTPINTAIANATAISMVQRYPDVAGNIDVESSSWARSLFRRMGFVRRHKTSSKVEIPDKVREEIEFLFYYDIVSYVEKYDIPHSLILNLDQTPLKYVPVSQDAMAARGATSVTIEGSNDKRMITGTFAIMLSGKFLPVQLIYAGKTMQSVPKVSFPKEFSLSANPTHFSNAEESIKFLNEVINPYVEKERSN